MMETAWDSRQLCVLRFGLLQKRNVRIGIFPESEEILVGNFRFRRVAGQSIGTTETKMCQRADRLISHNAGMIETPLELACGAAAVFRRQISLAPEIDGIEREREIIVGVSHFIGRSGGQSIQSGSGISTVER